MAEVTRWAVVVHGGCKPIEPEEAAAHRNGCRDAVLAATRVLIAGGPALDAVEAAVRVLEADPTFNAGRGASLNADGLMEMDAAVMDGDTLGLGGVAAAERLLHPISVARAMVPEAPTLLAGEGAIRFAASKGLDQRVEGQTPSASAHGDTVGCVALDQDGRIAAATSTGGLEGSPPGRVGDSPLPGCGIYADSAAGGVSVSGEGEQISRTLVSARAIIAMEQGADAQTAVEAALAHLARVGGDAGLIAIDRQGRIGIKHNATQFAVGWATSDAAAPHTEVSGLEETTRHA